MGDILITDGGPEHIEGCVDIAKRLPGFFTEKAVRSLGEDLREDVAYVALDPGGVAGFVVLRPDMEAREAEVQWLAVRPSLHRQGIGTLLLGRAESEMRVRGMRMLRVRTLAEEAHYGPYDATRRFYEVNGFEHVVTIPDYPLWDDGNPCAVFEKEL